VRPRTAQNREALDFVLNSAEMSGMRVQRAGRGPGIWTRGLTVPNSETSRPETLETIAFSWKRRVDATDPSSCDPFSCPN